MLTIAKTITRPVFLYILNFSQNSSDILVLSTWFGFLLQANIWHLQEMVSIVFALDVTRDRSSMWFMVDSCVIIWKRSIVGESAFGRDNAEFEKESWSVVHMFQ